MMTPPLSPNFCGSSRRGHWPWLQGVMMLSIYSIGRRLLRGERSDYMPTTTPKVEMHHEIWLHYNNKKTSLYLTTWGRLHASFFSDGFTIMEKKTTYENFRYRYDRRENPYNLGLISNFKEIFFTRIPPSRNNFQAKVTLDLGQKPRQSTGGFMSPNMGKGIGDIEMGRKAMAWGEQDAASAIDMETGLSSEAAENKDGRLYNSSLDSDRILPLEGSERTVMEHHQWRNSSWGRRSSSGSWDMPPPQLLPLASTDGNSNVVGDSVGMSR